MKKLLLSILIIGLCVQQAVYSQNNEKTLSKRIANYDIAVDFDAARKIVNGKLTLHWINTSPDTLRELQFHLYLNAFKNTNSTFLTEYLETRDLPENFNQDDSASWGWTDILSMKTKDGRDLLKNSAFIQPDDENKNDQTVLSVALEQPLYPGWSTDITMQFVSKLPRMIARSGYAGDYFLVGQWFPKIGVYESAGQRYARKGQWNCHQYHADSEFFADFGNYNVSINIPNDYIVGATGILVDEKKTNDQIKTLIFNAEDVIDFVWTASKDFKIVEDTWNQVKIRLLIQPEHQNFAERYIKSAKIAFEYFDRNLGKYPYPMLTIVDPPYKGAESGGMEYPMLVTGDSYAYVPDGFKMVENVTIHEIGHQYFMGMLASNEFEEAWLDEGFNTYFETRIMDEMYGEDKSLIDFWGIQVSDFESNRVSYIHSPNPKIGESFKNSWEFKDGSYGMLSYDKPAVWLTTLDRMLGREMMNEIMKTYFERWKFKHPCGNDFIKITNEIASKKPNKMIGSDLNWFFAQVLYRSDVCDFQLESIENTPITSKTGYFDSGKSKQFENESNDKIFISKVKINRLGELIFPVEVLVHFENGEEFLETWDGRSRTHEFVYQSTKKIVWAKIDPQNKIVMDINQINNSFTLEPETNPIWKYTLKFLFWVQNVLQSITFFV